jgi:hypothetical protein
MSRHRSFTRFDSMIVATFGRDLTVSGRDHGTLGAAAAFAITSVLATPPASHSQGIFMIAKGFVPSAVANPS